jgi:hypothetical protein
MTAKRASKSRGIRRERTPFEWALLVVSLAATLAMAGQPAVLLPSDLVS